MPEADVRIRDLAQATFGGNDPMARLAEEFGPLPHIEEIAEGFGVSIIYVLGLESPGMWN